MLNCFRPAFIIAFIIICVSASGQIKIGKNVSEIHKASILELESDDKGVLLPRLSDTLQINLNDPPEGMLIYLTKENGGVYVRIKNKWQALSPGKQIHQIFLTADSLLALKYTDSSIYVSTVKPLSFGVQNALSIQWIGELGTAPPNPSVNTSYHDSATKASYIWDGKEWKIISKDGKDGKGIFWRGSFKNAPDQPSINDAYYDSTLRKSLIWNGIQWQILSQDGFASADTGTFDGHRPITADIPGLTGFNPLTDNPAKWIEAVFYPAEKPNFSLLFDINHANSFPCEQPPGGSTIPLVLSWSVSRKASTSEIAEILIGTQTQSFQQPAQSQTVSGNTTVDFSSTKNNEVLIVKMKDGKIYTASVQVYFQLKRFFGFITIPGANGSDYNITEGQIKNLNAELAAGRSFTKQVNPSGLQRLAIAYPSAWGMPSAIKDANGFDISSVFDVKHVSVSNPLGFTCDYIVLIHRNNTDSAITFTLI